MEAEYILAIDLGTTNCKTILLNTSCEIVRKVVIEYAVAFPQPGWAEQQPEDWWSAVKDCLCKITRDVPPQSIKCIGLSGQMHGLVLLDESGKVIRPAILWNDQRSFEQCTEIYARAGGPRELLRFTNNPMIPGYTGGKILWVRENEPDNYQKISKILLPKDYIRYCLTGALATDESDASGTGLFDVKNRKWSEGLIALLDIPLVWFPACYPSPEIVAGVSPTAAAETGLAPGTPVIAGGGDAVMQTVGGGATNSDKALIVVGTGGNVTVSMPHFSNNPGGRLQSFCHVLPNMWVEMGVTLTAGSSLKWFRDTLGALEVEAAKSLEVSSYELLSQQAAKSPPGSRNLLFLPYLQGERCPHVDVFARGTWVGLSLSTRKADLVRSVMEGVTFSLRDVFELIVQTGANPGVVLLSGGGAASPIWRQIHADIFNREVITLDYSEDAGALGAGIVAGLSAGFWPSADQAVEKIFVRTANQPDPQAAMLYAELFRIYKDLYPAVKPAFDKFASLVHSTHS